MNKRAKSHIWYFIVCRIAEELFTATRNVIAAILPSLFSAPRTEPLSIFDILAKFRNANLQLEMAHQGVPTTGHTLESDSPRYSAKPMNFFWSWSGRNCANRRIENIASYYFQPRHDLSLWKFKLLNIDHWSPLEKL
jgi:hypothetical protein